MDILRTHLHAEGIAIARGLEGLIPPACAVQESAANRLRRARIEVIDDRLDRIGDLGPGIHLGDAMTTEETLLERRAERRRAVLEVRPEETGAGIEVACLVAGTRQFHERVMDAQARRFAGGGHVTHTF